MEHVETAVVDALKESTHDDDHLEDTTAADDPLAAARSLLAGEDRTYWSAHPELPGLVSYFLANALARRPSDTRAFAAEMFGQLDLKDRVHAAIKRNGGCFSVDQQPKAPASSRKREKKHKK